MAHFSGILVQSHPRSGPFKSCVVSSAVSNRNTRPAGNEAKGVSISVGQRKHQKRKKVAVLVSTSRCSADMESALIRCSPRAGHSIRDVADF